MPLHDTRYQHWEGLHLGVWRRRLVIAQNGLRACLQLKGMWQVVAGCWIVGLGMAALLFLIGQLLVTDSIVVQWAGTFPDLQNFVQTLTSWLEKHPEVSVRCTQNVLFYFFCAWQTFPSIFALGLIIPFLITRDLGSNAIIIYSSKAVTRGDYLLGKFLTAFGLLSLTWLGPVCAAWFLGNLLAPDWRFFWHARAALGHSLLYGLSTMTILSVLALGVSSLSSKEKATPAFWLMWWIIGRMIIPIAVHTLPSLRHLSFGFNVRQIAISVFRPLDDLKTAQEQIPWIGQTLSNIRLETMTNLSSPPIWGALFALLLMLILAAIIINRRVRPE
jgi:hypothetical protein